MKKSGRRRNQLLKDANLVIARKNDEAIQISGPSYPWLAADGISNSFANKSVIAFAHYLDPIRKAFRADGFRFSATGGPAYGWQASGFRLPTLPMSRY